MIHPVGFTVAVVGAAATGPALGQGFASPVPEHALIATAAAAAVIARTNFRFTCSSLSGVTKRSAEENVTSSCVMGLEGNGLRGKQDSAACSMDGDCCCAG